MEGMCLERRGRYDGPNGKGQEEGRRGTRHGKVLTIEQGKSR